MNTKFRILRTSISTNALCIMVSQAVDDLQREGYTQIQFEYSTAYDSHMDAIDYSILIIATKE